MLNRRSVILGLLAASQVSGSAFADDGEFSQRIAELEARGGGRLGVCVIDTATGRSVAHRGDERFPFCSTYKLLAATFLLKRVEAGQEQLDRRIRYGVADLVGAAPYTGKYAGGSGVSLQRLAEAAMTQSDGTAANLIVETFGGPAELTRYARTLGDAVTRVDRYEPELAEAVPGDPRDTTSPNAMAENVRKVVMGEALQQAGTAQMVAWLMANRTGDERLRAGTPDDWIIGDKTGSSRNGATNDIGFMQPPGRSPLIVAAYYAESKLNSAGRSAVLADVARVIVQTL
ncbi:beta-lactamase [Devosia limi DSM 17137]|uniref:beta-lactamase n=1 Tax=Devosia limi DSM 17137 TaxID=1121477 RepID=A0A0F5LSE2_9HYPH|nr:beta-lactamase [Devosia limi DSM 17137]